MHKELLSSFIKKLFSKYNMPDSLIETFVNNCMVFIDEYNKDAITDDTLWQRIVVDHFDDEFGQYIQQSDHIIFLLNRLCEDELITIQDKYGKNPRLNHILKESLTKYMNEIFYEILKEAL